MISFNDYIVEKLHLNKDSKYEPYKIGSHCLYIRKIAFHNILFGDKEFVIIEVVTIDEIKDRRIKLHKETNFSQNRNGYIYFHIKKDNPYDVLYQESTPESILITDRMTCENIIKYIIRNKKLSFTELLENNKITKGKLESSIDINNGVGKFNTNNEFSKMQASDFKQIDLVFHEKD